jgi:hypothetical protein
MSRTHFKDSQVATSETARDINRGIVLNLIRINRLVTSSSSCPSSAKSPKTIDGGCSVALSDRRTT